MYLNKESVHTLSFNVKEQQRVCITSKSNGILKKCEPVLEVLQKEEQVVFKNGKEFGEDSILKTEVGNEQKNVTMAENEMTYYQVCGWRKECWEEITKNTGCIV